MYILKKFNEAKKNYEKAIQLKPDFTDAYFNLGSTLKDIGEIDSAEFNFRKVLSLQPKYPMQDSLQLILKLKKLLLNVEKNKKNKKEQNYNLISTKYNSQNSENLFIANRLVEKSLIKYLYEIKSRKFDETIDARYGKGICSVDFDLFDNSHSTLVNLSKDLINICQNALGSKIYIFDSFFNILNAEGGTKPHNHIIEFDKSLGLVNKKYSLTYT